MIPQEREKHKRQRKKNGCAAGGGALPCTRRGVALHPAGRCPAPGGALPLHPTPARRAAGRCPCTPRL
ncbi:hypothetical protein D7X33_11565, partial [Butyricicoccus sp. 1XD8-22]